MAEVKSAFEKAMEKINEIEGFTPEEKTELKDREQLKSLLAAFYRGELKRDEMWEKFRGMKPHLLGEAQRNLAGSLRLLNAPEEFQLRKDGLLAIEALKEKRNSAALENTLNAIARLQKEYREGKERALRELRAAIEQNPQMRMRPVRTSDGRTVYQPALSVDEAVQSRIAEFLDDHEMRFETMFGQALERLEKELR